MTNTQNRILVTVVGVLIIISAIFFSYKNFLGPIKINEIKDDRFSIFLDNKQKEFVENTDWYEVKIKYPEQNSMASDFIFKQWNDFANEYQLKKYKNRKEASEPLGLFNNESKDSFLADYKLVEGGTLFGTSTLSYIYTVYTFTGGAHGATNIAAFTVDEYGRVYNINEILPDDKLAKVSEYAYADLTKQRREKLENSGQKFESGELNRLLSDTEWLREGTKATRENYSVAWPDGDYVVISFGQYQIASYAEGIFEVKVPKSLLK